MPNLGARMKTVAILVAVSMTIFAAAPAAPNEGPKLVLTRLTDKLYVAEDFSFAKENSLVYIGNTYVTVIGATWTPRTASRLAEEISGITSKPIGEVVNTNHDLDRAGGNAFFNSIGARIVSTKMTRDLLEREGKRSVELMRLSYPDYPEVEIVLPDEYFPGDFALQDGDLRCIYLGPSHKPDDIFVNFPKEKVLYGGCILKEELGSLDGADLVEYPRTLMRLKELDLDIDTIVAGHFTPVQGPELIDRYLRLLEQNRR